jgi:hypothetical protein
MVTFGRTCLASSSSGVRGLCIAASTRQANATRIGASSINRLSNDTHARLQATPFVVPSISSGHFSIYHVESEKMQVARFSSSANDDPGVWGKIKGAFNNRLEKRKVDKTKEQITKMAQMETWTLQAFLNEINEGMGSWAAKIPGIGNAPEKKQMEQSQKILEAIVAQVGGDVTPLQLSKLDRKQKLSICLKGQTTMDSVNIVMSQFRNMELMHRVIRYRAEQGKELPTNEAAIQAAMQEDAAFVTSPEEKKVMREQYIKRQGKSRGGQR